MKIIKDFKYLIIIFLFLVIEEILFMAVTYSDFSINMILFTLFNTSIIYIIQNLFKTKKILYILLPVITFIFISNYLYYSIYSTFITIDLFFKSFKVIYFGSNIFSLILSNIIGILSLIIPLIISILFIKKNEYKKTTYKINIPIIIVTYLICTISLLFSNNTLYSPKNLYYKVDFPNKNLNTFGLITSIRLNIQRSIFGFKELEVKVEKNDKVYTNKEYNILDIDFKESDNKDINLINEYLENKEPTKKNEYTGLLKNKNLIFIVAESFHTIGINKEVTPNLYKIYNEGFKFNNFYSPLYPVSTADGQYLIDVSLFPSDATNSLIKTNTNYIPYSLGNMFKDLNYKTYSYHNYFYDYYERDKYYPNMGYGIYKARNNSTIINNGSDYEMALNTINEYIKEDKFMVYYLTYSGHANYTNENPNVKKFYDEVKHLNYSQNVKNYLSTQVQLDKMIGVLLDELEKNNKLNNTTIVVIPDHVPFALSINEMNELSTFTRDNEWEKYRSSLIIYDEDLNKHKGTDNYCSNIDLLPTMLNLFGMEYDSRLLMGKDILSNNDGFVIFGNRNFITKDYKYSNMEDRIYGNITREQVEKIQEENYMKFKVSRLMLNNNYYDYLFN